MSGGAPPPGVVVAIFDPEKRSVASASDFDISRPGGFPLRQAQAHRARSQACRRAVEAYCSDCLASLLEADDIERLWKRLEKAGWQLMVIPVGYEQQP